MRKLCTGTLVLGLLLMLGGPALAALVGTPIGTTNGTLLDNGDGTYTISEAGGHDLWGNADTFFFAYEDGTGGEWAGSGDGALIAQVTNNVSGGEWSRIGVMFRESLNADSRHFTAGLGDISNGRGINTHRTDTAGGTERDVDLNDLGYTDVWLKAERIGNSFTAYNSADGVTWTQMGSTNDLAFASSDAFVGFFAHGRNDSSFTTATYANVQLLPILDYTWDDTNNDWGSDHWGMAGDYPAGDYSRAIVNGGVVTVEAAHSARSLTIGADGTVSVGAGNSLSLNPDSLSSEGTLNLGSGATLSASGNAALVTAEGMATVNVPGTLVVTDYAYTGAADGQLVKTGDGTLVIANMNAVAPAAKGMQGMKIEAGEVVRYGTDPLGGASTLELAGGTLTAYSLRTATNTGSVNRLTESFYSGTYNDAQIFPIDAGQGYLVAKTPVLTRLLGEGLDTATGLPNGVTESVDLNFVQDTYSVRSNATIGGTDGDAPDYYGVAYSGTITIEDPDVTGFESVLQPGMYSFATNSDDGSSLYIGGQLVVNNGGFHGGQWRYGSVYLGPGSYDFKVGMYEGGGGDQLLVKFAPGVVTDETQMQFINPAKSDYTQYQAWNSAGTIDAGSGMIDMSGATVEVTNGGTLNLHDNSGAPAEVGEVVLGVGTLVTMGSPINIGTTTFAAGATEVGIDPQSATDFNFDGTGFGGVLVKQGTSAHTMGPSANMGNASFGVADGSLTMVGLDSWGDSTSAVLRGGTMTIENTDVDVVPGLSFGTVPGNLNSTTPNPVNLALDPLGPTYSEVNEGEPYSTTPWDYDATLIYTGEIQLPGGRVDFTEDIDDVAWLVIDGLQILNDGNWDTDTFGAITRDAGWYSFELRMSNGGGGAGIASSPHGFAWDPTGSGSTDPAAGVWAHPENSVVEEVVQMDVFRTVVPIGPTVMTAHSVTVESSATLNADTITNESLALGSLTLMDGAVLTTTGAPISFTTTTMAGATEVGFDPQTATSYNFDGTGFTGRLLKEGGASHVMEDSTANMDDAAIGVAGGSLTMDGLDPWGGSTSMWLRGGTMTIMNSPGLVLSPGLAFGTLAGNVNTTTPNSVNEGFDPLGPTYSEINEGEPYPNTPWDYDTTLVYTGEIQLPGGQVDFTEDIDDKAWLVVDGEQVLFDNDGWDTDTFGSITRDAGWYAFELRISNGGGGAGIASSPHGFAWDPTGSGSTDPTADVWAHPENSVVEEVVQMDVFRVMAPTGPTDMTSHTVTVDGAATLHADYTTNTSLALGGLNLMEGAVLTTTGVPISFTGTTVDPAAMNVALDPQTATSFGVVDGSGGTATIAKVGSGDLILDAGAVNVSTAAFSANAGRMIVRELPAKATAVGDAGLKINGGELVLSGATTDGAVTYSNTLEGLANGTLTAGAGGNGTTGVAVTLGGPVTLTSGTVAMRSQDGYTLTVGDVAGPGGMSVAEGDVTLGGSSDIGSLTLSGGMLSAVSDINVANALVTGGQLGLGGNQLVVSDTLNVGSASYSISAGNTIAAEGTDLPSAMDLTVAGGIVTLSSTTGGGGIQLEGINIDAGLVGSYTYDANTGEHAVVGGGADIWGGSDQFYFAQTAVGTDPISLLAHVESIALEPGYDGLNGWAKAGVMVRDKLVGNSVHVSTADTPENGVAAQGRSAEGDNNYNIGSSTVAFAAAWLRVDFDPATNTATHYRSADAGTTEVGAINWEQFHQQVVSPTAGTEFYVGLSVTSHDTADLVRAVYTNLYLNDTEVGPFSSVELVELGTNIVVAADTELVPATGVTAAKVGNLTLLEGVDTLTLSGMTYEVGDLTTPAESTIVGNLNVRGTVNVGGSPGTLHLTDTFEFLDSAVYHCEIGNADVGPANDLISSMADVNLAGALSLTAVAKLHSPVPHPTQPSIMREWYGFETRTIISTDADPSGEASVLWDFASVPDAGSHLGYGVFLQGVNLEPTAVTLDLLQAAPGDTDGDLYVNGIDIQNILAANKFGLDEDADWMQGDMTGDQRVNGLDIQAILSANLFGLQTPYAATDPGELGEGAVDLVVVPGEGVYLDTKGTTINSYVLTSQAGVFTGEPADNLGLFTEDTDDCVSGSFAFALNGEHFLGNILGSSATGSKADLLEDLYMTYTIDGMNGTYEAKLIIVPEPGTLILLASGLAGLLVLAIRRRRRKA